MRVISSAGRARRSHRRGHWFKSSITHQYQTTDVKRRRQVVAYGFSFSLVVVQVRYVRARTTYWYDVSMTIEHIAADIAQRGGKAKPILIGIEGYGGVGKTSVAKQLADSLGSAYVVNLDDFIIKEKLAEPSWDSGVFDRARLERQVLQPASRGEPIRYQRLQWVMNTLSAPVTVPVVDYLIIEGIAAYHPTIERFYDYKIWVDTPIDIAQQRGHARDGSNENAAYWERWAQNDVAYQRRYHPERRADYVFRNA